MTESYSCITASLLVRDANLCTFGVVKNGDVGGIWYSTSLVFRGGTNVKYGYVVSENGVVVGAWHGESRYLFGQCLTIAVIS